MMIEVEPLTHISLPDLIARRKEIRARFMRASCFDAASRPTPQQKLRAILAPPGPTPAAVPEEPPHETREVSASASPEMSSPLPIRRIIAEVAAFHEISVGDMIRPDKHRRFVRPRQIACYLAKILTSRSFPEIGRRVGRDHTTVLHSFRLIGALMLSDDNLAAEIAALTRRLAPGGPQSRSPECSGNAPGAAGQTHDDQLATWQ
jgi:hypothetical protein